MQPSRRAFLSGRRPPPSVWATFCRRLRGACDGIFDDLGEATGVGRAHFVPAGSGDMAVAVSLAREYGVLLALEGEVGQVVEAPGDRPAMHIDASLLDELTPVHAFAAPGNPQPAAPIAWDAQPGCRLSALAAAGLQQFVGAPADITLAQWLAAPHPELPSGQTSASGVIAVEALFADGTFEALGPFGAHATQPLQSATVRALVPRLFQLAASEDARMCRAHPHWQPGYRLDALLPSTPHAVNLGQVVLGHGGTLLWVCSVRLCNTGPVVVALDAGAARSDGVPVEKEEMQPTEGTLVAPGALPANGAGVPEAAAQRLLQRVKMAFDPGEQFPMFG